MTDSQSTLAPAVNDSWRWIAENKLLRATDRSMIDALVANGIPEDIARQAIEAAGQNPYLQGAEWIAQRLRKLESLMEVYRKLANQSPAAGTVEYRPSVSREVFLERYYSLNRPVVLTRAMTKWKAMRDWNPEYFKTHFGHETVEIMSDRDADPRYEIESHRHKKSVRFADYVDLVTRPGESNDYYLAGNNRLFDKPWAARLLDDIEIFPEYLKAGDTTGKMFFWFGPAGTVTPMHHDTMNILMAQVYGRKRVKLVPSYEWPLVYNSVGVFSDVDPERPDEAACPKFRDATVIDLVLEPGQVLFLPVGWWHHVRALDVSITVTFTNFVFDNDYHWEQPHIVRR
jgi:ribosomal protein L16 Arg81 hydroxylase